MKRKLDEVLHPKKKNLTSIRERFRYFKQKKAQPDFANLSNELVNDLRVLKSSKIFKSDSKIFRLESGLVLIKSLLEPEYAEKLGKLALETFPIKADAKSNLGKLGEDVNIAVSSFDTHSDLKKTKLFGLRWVTLGHHHNWDTRVYDKNILSVGKMPEELDELGKEISRCFEFTGSFNPQASICNYYPANVGTIGIHTDNSEYCQHPIVSISLGLPCIFLLGKNDRDGPCHELFLEHGDVLIMDGRDRNALHAVPRVLDLETAEKFSSNYKEKLKISDRKTLNYLSQARININLRQVS